MTAETRSWLRRAAGAGAILAAVAVVWSLRGGEAPSHAREGRAQDVDSRGRVPASRRTVVLHAPDDLQRLVLEGVVLDEHDRPVRDAEVQMIGLHASARTDPEGRFAFEGVTLGSYRLDARTDEAYGGPVHAHVTANPSPVIIRLRRGLVLEIEVLAAGANGATPLAGASVALISMSPVFGEGLGAGSSITRRTDQRGIAVFPAVPGEDTVAVASHDGFVPLSRVVAAQDVDGFRHRVLIKLSPGGQARGRVVDDQQRPIAGVTVMASRLPPTDMVWTQGIAQIIGSSAVTTDDDGQFRLDLEEGGWFLRAVADGYGPAAGEQIGITVGRETSGITLVLSGGIHVLGRVVTAEGAPATGVHVTASPRYDQGVLQRVQANANGDFDLSGLPATWVRIWASTPDATSTAIELDLTGNQDVTDLVVTLDRTGIIRGRVVDARGRPVEGAAVSCLGVVTAPDDRILFGRSPPIPHIETTDASGRFELRGLERAFPPETLPESVRAQAASFEARYQLDAWAPSSRIGARVRSTVVLARVGDAVELRMPLPGTVVGRVRRADGGQVDRAWVGWNIDAWVVGNGASFRLPVDSPGLGSVRVAVDGILKTIEVEVPPGETVDVGELVFGP